jgi:hypothetical protein
LVAAIGLSLPVGYLLFWGPYGMSVLWKAHPISYFGPFYWLPVVVPVTVLATLGLRALRVQRPRATAAVVVAMLLVNGVTVAHAVDRNREYTEQSQFTHADLPQPPPGQQWLVFVPQQYGPYLMHPFTFIRDEPDFRGPVLYALDRGRDNFPVMADHPARTPFRMRVKGVVNDEPSSRARLTLEPIANLTAASFEVEVTIQNPTSRPHVALQVLRHGREDWIVLDHSSARGRTYNVRLRVAADDLEPLTRSISHDVHLRRKRTGLPFTISAIFSPTSSWSRRTVVEWLVWDRTTAAGELVFQAPFDARRMANWPRGHWVWDRKTKLVTVRVRTLQGNAPGPWTDVRPPN